MSTNKLNIRTLFMLLSFFVTGTSIAQDKKEKDKDANIQNIISAKNFDFVAEYMSPLGAPSKYLSSRYDMRLSNDSLQTYLPYFGRAYVAPIDPDDAGINFTSTNFNYNIADRKKGGWDITILPKDTRDVRQLYLTVFEDGRATLQVVSNSKQAISYSGYIRENKKK